MNNQSGRPDKTRRNSKGNDVSQRGQRLCEQSRNTDSSGETNVTRTSGRQGIDGDPSQHNRVDDRCVTNMGNDNDDFEDDEEENVDEEVEERDSGHENGTSIESEDDSDEDDNFLDNINRAVNKGRNNHAGKTMWLRTLCIPYFHDLILVVCFILS